MTAGPSAPQELSGRGEVITAFETVAGSESAPWVMLVDGISGSGKSTLAEWLCASWSAECPCSRLELTRTLNVEDVLRRLAAGFAPAIAARLDEELREVDAAARSIIDVDYSPKQSMDASRRASIDSSHQQANLTVDLGSYSESVLLEQRTRRLNALERALAPLRGTRWILFIDECEHLEHPDVSQFVLGELVQRLRASFPAMRLYLTGQSVPTARFGLADRLTRTLESFSEEVTASIAGEAGLGEDAVGLVYELSRGHPLLVGMAIELLSSLDGPLTAHLIAELERDLDDRARTEWLYGRILNRLPEGLRDIATHLALLEWFDLDVLGRLFDDVDAEVFDELERRSFIKTRPDRTLTCHDAIRRHLGRSMLERDARASRDFLRRAAAAYRDALNDEVIRLESIFVGGRLDYVSAAFRAACVGDPGSASMILTDIGLAVRAVHRDHAYSVLRVVEETAELPARLDGLARRMRNFLEREAGLQPMNEDAVFLLLDVAAQCHADGFDDLADWLRYRASGWARSAGKSELACSIAAEALEHVDDVANRLLLVRALVADGRSDDASEALTSAELAHDAPVPFGLMRAEIELLDGADDEALSRVRALQTDHPDESGSATRFLAEMLGDAGEFDQALRVLDELSDDDEVEATRELRARILISAGRVGEALEHVTPDAADVAEYEILLHLAERTAATQERLDEFITKFILDPTTSSFVEIVAVCDVASLRGWVESTKRLAVAAQEAWPEAATTFELKVVTALLRSPTPEEGVRRLEVLRHSSDLPDVTILLAQHVLTEREYDRARQLLAETRERWPHLSGRLDRLIAQSFMAEERPQDAIDYLESIEDLGAHGRAFLAHALVARGSVDAAIDEFDRIIHTNSSQELARSELAELRLRMVQLLWARDTERARDVLATTMTLYGKIPAVAFRIATMCASTGDDATLAELRAMHPPNSGPSLAALEVQARLLAARQPSPDVLLEILGREPGRDDVLLAFSLAVQANSDPKEIEDYFRRAIAVDDRIAGRLTDFQADADQLVLLTDVSAFWASVERTDFATVPRPQALEAIAGAQLLASHRRIVISQAIELIERIRRLRSDVEFDAIDALSSLLSELPDLDSVEALLGPYLDDPNSVPRRLRTTVLSYWDARERPEQAIGVLRAALDDPMEFDQQVIRETIAAFQMDIDPADALATIAEMETAGSLTGGQRFMKAKALMRTEQLDEALAVASAVRDDMTNSAKDRGNAAWLVSRVHAQSDRPDAAVAALQQAAELDPTDPTVWALLAEALENRDPAAALMALETGCRLKATLRSEYAELHGRLAATVA